MENIFENAKFGDKFITNDGKLGIFLNKDCHHVQLIYEDGARVFLNNSGREQECKENDYDIVGKWERPIDENKLNEMAEKHCENYDFEPTQRNSTDSGWEYGHTYTQLVECYKAGYRKAKEE